MRLRQNLEKKRKIGEKNKKKGIAKAKRRGSSLVQEGRHPSKLRVNSTSGT